MTPPPAPVHPQLPEFLLGRETGQALVPEDHGDIDFLSESSGERFRLQALRTALSIHVQRKSHDDFSDLLRIHHPSKEGDIPIKTLPDPRGPALDGHAEPIGDSDTDTAISDVESQRPDTYISFHHCIIP